MKALAIILAAAAALAGCAEKSAPATSPTPAGATSAPAAANPYPLQAGELKQAGSSTVFPIAFEWAADVVDRTGGALRVNVAGGGSGAGATKLCNGEIDLADMSSRMKDEQKAACAPNGVVPMEWHVAYDGLSVVVSKKNAFVDQLTVEELKRLWAQNSTVRTWADLRAGWPDKPVKLFGAGTASGTYEYFNEEILGKTCGADGKRMCPPRQDYTPSEDDNVLVEGVRDDEHALAYFGFSYYLENTGTLRAVPIAKNATSPYVSPSFETIRDGSYKPLARPLFVYVDQNGFVRGSALHAYVAYMMYEGQALVAKAGAVGLDDATLAAQRARL
ncbi:MAG TPA: phosphate ABC transporter substrate-binding protein PstS family protein [Candidatus Thermoplasmatota archaeon]|nr:phosphate ABC transporter substrate-binding protein PstS family protein [Candidatus Thermoplasmatota archaeon]